ncbi:MAG: Hpt domain-containing protein [Tsuneonella sp.]
MSDAPPVALAAKLAELSQRFVTRAADERAVLERAIADNNRVEIAHLAHKLAGNAGMFGQPEIGAAAFALEEAAETDTELGPAAGRLLSLLAAL